MPARRPCGPAAVDRLCRRELLGTTCVATSASRRGFGASRPGYLAVMLYTIFLVLAIIALLVFIFGRARI